MRPFLDRLGAVDVLRTNAPEYTHSPARLLEGAVVLGAAVFAFAHALRRAELVLEASGDVRFRRAGMFGGEEWSVPPAAVESLVESSGEVTLLWRREDGTRGESRVFATNRTPPAELRADVAVASQALRDLIRRRAAG